MNRGVNHLPGFACKPSTRDVQMKKVAYTVFASSPFLAVGLFLGSMNSPEFARLLDAMSTLTQALIGGFFLVALLAYFWDVWNSPRMPRSKRALWTAVLFLGNWYALPFYWWFYIRGPGTEQHESTGV